MRRGCIVREGSSFSREKRAFPYLKYMELFQLVEEGGGCGPPPSKGGERKKKKLTYSGDAFFSYEKEFGGREQRPTISMRGEGGRPRGNLSGIGRKTVSIYTWKGGREKNVL